VHGIPGGFRLKEGDIISVDCGAIIEGYHGDAAYTAGVGDVSDAARRLMDVTERSLWAGIDQLVIGNRLNEVGRAVQNVADQYVFSYKPNPAIFATDNWRPEEARRELITVLERARGCHVEIIMKDISTVRYQPQRLWEWAAIAMDLVQRFRS